jgi:hypothetical protein
MAAQLSDLEQAYSALFAKQYPYSLLNDYFIGKHPLQYATRRLSQIFSTLDQRWIMNMCSTVVNITLDRIDLSGFSMKDKVAKALLDKVWAQVDAGSDVDKVHKAVAIFGEGFLIMNQDADGEIHMHANRPHLVHAFYEEDNPKHMSRAAKWWEYRGNTFLTLYYDDRFEYYMASGLRADLGNAGAFRPVEELPYEDNPYGRIPLYHFAIDTEDVRGELNDIVTLQNAINKLTADMMVTAEFGAFQQRYVVSSADVGNLKNAPSEIWALPAGSSGEESTQVGQFAASDLKNYTDTINDLLGKVSICARVPKHYLLQVGNDTSGDALQAMEAPLVKKIIKYEKRLGITWSQVASFVLELSGHPIPPEEISIIWADSRTKQSLMESQSHLQDYQAGMPLVTQLRLEGWTIDQLAQMQQDIDDAMAKQKTMGDVVTEKVTSAFDQGANASPYNSSNPASVTPLP